MAGKGGGAERRDEPCSVVTPSAPPLRRQIVRSNTTDADGAKQFTKTLCFGVALDGRETFACYGKISQEVLSQILSLVNRYF